MGAARLVGHSPAVEFGSSRLSWNPMFRSPWSLISTQGHHWSAPKLPPQAAAKGVKAPGGPPKPMNPSGRRQLRQLVTNGPIVAVPAVRFDVSLFTRVGPIQLEPPSMDLNRKISAFEL